MKNVTKRLKKVGAIVAMAAVALTAIPAGKAEAASCSHNYHTYCLGYYTHVDGSHMYDRWYRYSGDLFWRYEYAECMVRDVYHGDRQQCTKCGCSNGGIGTHLGSTIHMDCTTSTATYCSGTGTDLTAVY